MTAEVCHVPTQSKVRVYGRQTLGLNKNFSPREAYSCHLNFFLQALEPYTVCM